MQETPAQMLRRHGLRPKHSWGQNFLGDEYMLQKIAEAADLSPGEVVVELGPGLGHLTRALLFQGAKVVAVERDRDMAKVLRAEFQTEDVTVLEANAVEVEFASLAHVSKVTVVGNLPYHLSSPILFRVLEQEATIGRAVFTLQKEVVTRLSAKPGNRDYGLLTVLLGLGFEVEGLFDIPAHAFFPPPKVDSAVVRLTSRAQPKAQVADARFFKKVVKAAFAQRRKTLSNSLASDKSLGTSAHVKRALDSAQIDPQRRAETLSIEEFATLAQALSKGLNEPANDSK